MNHEKKIGRPKLEKPKSIEIKVRVDEDTNNKINTYCEENEINKSVFLRKAIDKFFQKK